MVERYIYLTRLTLYYSKAVDKISEFIHVCILFCPFPYILSPCPPQPSPTSKLVALSICVLKGFFVNQAICPSLFGVQTVVRYPVTDPVCYEWQLLSGQLAEGLKNIPERII